MIMILLLAVAATTATPPAKPARDPAKMRCVRETETGSLSKINKVCHTEAEWQAIRTYARDTATTMQSSTGVGQNPN